ncbi:MAG: CDP-glycerol glycerophosphotransferase [Solirubrobacteraceae bacterium]|nr:CDP-glycerol glycerophosphotransferase [Solirubrobacteraceae bacterium]
MRRPSILRRARPGAADSAADLARQYEARRREPLDGDLAVFAAYWNRGYACNPRAIYERALELVPGLRGVWVVRRALAATMPAGVEVVHPATSEYFDAIARAGWLVNNVNWPNNLVKREGQVHVMTHHGTPLKKMGLDLRGVEGREKDEDFDAFLRRCARWDYSVAANPFSTQAWSGAYPGLSFASLETGYPRNDVLASATAADVARARSALGLADDAIAVLYAPTHREYETDGSELVDLAALAAGLGPEHVVLARQHYLEKEGLASGGGHVVDVSAHPSVEELCLAADVLVTDYSSIMFDFAVLDRPIIIHAADWETYRAKRGTYFDLMAEPPGVVTRSGAELADALREGADDPAARAAFRERFCALEDGGAAERVVRAVFGERVVA